MIRYDAFAPFILEGSHPGSAAAGLWLATQVMPLDMRGHGAIVKSTVLAARELYEWLTHWSNISRINGMDDEFELFPLTEFPPDTNIVIFAVRKKVSRSLKAMNQLTDAVYEKFSIQAELGDREYSYSQPFFLSRTRFNEPQYSYKALASFFNRADIRDAQSSYAQLGVSVLRATVMNPFITPLRQQSIQFLIKEFLQEVSETAANSARSLDT